LDIPQQAKNRMVELLQPILESAEIGSGGYLDIDAYDDLEALEQVPPTAVREALATMIGPRPISDFIYDELKREFERLDLEGDVEPLTTHVPDTRALAERLIDALEGLPRRYRIALEMPASLTKLFTAVAPVIQIFEGMTLIAKAPSESTEEPTERVPGPFGELRLRWADGTETPLGTQVELQIEFEGYASDSTATESVADVLEEAKALIGSMVGHKIIKVYVNGVGRPRPAPRFSVYEESRAGAVQRGAFSPEFGALRIAPTQLSRVRILNAALRNELARAQLLGIGRMFERRSGKRLYGTLILGSKWLLDSYLNHDKVLSYVQATVALETLLGDHLQSEKVGVGALLGNRCAYLIAESLDERRQLLKSFSEIYDVRSKIVHRGQSRLSHDDQYRLSQLQRICGRVILHETRLIAPAPQANQQN